MNDDLPTLGIGVDIGGTSTKAAVIDAAGNVVASTVLPTLGGDEGVVSTRLYVSAQIARDFQRLVPRSVTPW